MLLVELPSGGFASENAKTAERVLPGDPTSFFQCVGSTGAVDVRGLPQREWCRRSEKIVMFLFAFPGGGPRRSRLLQGGGLEFARGRQGAQTDGEIVLLKAYLERAIQSRLDVHTGAAQTRANVWARDLVNLGLETDGVVVGHLPGFDYAERRRQIVLRAQRPVRIDGADGNHLQMLIPPL